MRQRMTSEDNACLHSTTQYKVELLGDHSAYLQAHPAQYFYLPYVSVMWAFLIVSLMKSLF